MKKLPRDDRRAKYIATNKTVDAEGLAAHLVGNNQWVLSTVRADGRPQMSLVTGAMLPEGRMVVATYPSRVKVKNIRRNPLVSIAVMGGEFNDAWVQIDGDAEILDMPEASDALVEYFRAISGEHDDWDEYRQAMLDQGKCAIMVTPTRWGPVSTGGFPPELFEDA
ncbi:MAG: PPOX class F420-dependent oxidoreductase [Acidimicrobiia bacterium]|nr:PPOX class F420-dependent oxidoreductase [Acidimicrobiia bacterium]